MRSRIRSTKSGRVLHGTFVSLIACEPRRGLGFAAAACIILGAGLFGAVKGEHLPALQAQWHDLCDGAANSVGLRVEQVTLFGQKQISPVQIFAAAGLTGNSSLPFLDLARAREQLKANPWIAEATLKKFYPSRVEIEIIEREAFALWQNDGRISVIASDGTALQPYGDTRFAKLPLVVGAGAEKRAKDIVALVADFPEIEPKLRAAILIAERRWNLRLKNGIDIRLPEAGADTALQTLVKLDREQGLLSRDIVAVDLRLPDRVSVQLSDAAAEARSEALKKKPKGKGSDA